MLSRLAFALAALSLFSACSVESTAPEPSGPCSDATLAPDEYVAGLTRAGKNGTVGVKLLDALPAPPAAGSNEWEVQLIDASNGPLPNAIITKVRLWMPSHGHGSGVTPTVTPGENGKATIKALEFVMPGVWTVTVSAQNEEATDEATFAFCIDG